MPQQPNPGILPNINQPFGPNTPYMRWVKTYLAQQQQEQQDQARIQQLLRERLPLELETQQEKAGLENRILRGRLDAFERLSQQQRINTRPSGEGVYFDPSPGAAFEMGGQVRNRGVYRNRPSAFPQPPQVTGRFGQTVPPEQLQQLPPQAINTQPVSPSTQAQPSMAEAVGALGGGLARGAGQTAGAIAGGAGRFFGQIGQGFKEGYYGPGGPPVRPSTTRSFGEAYQPSPAFQQGVNQSVTRDIDQLINTGPVQQQAQPQQQPIDQNVMDYMFSTAVLSGDFSDYSRTVAELVRSQTEAMQEQGLDRRSILNAMVQMANNQLDADSSKFSALAGMAGNAQTMGENIFGRSSVTRNQILQNILRMLGADVTQGQTGLGPMAPGVTVTRTR